MMQQPKLEGGERVVYLFCLFIFKTWGGGGGGGGGEELSALVRSLTRRAKQYYSKLVIYVGKA